MNGILDRVDDVRDFPFPFAVVDPAIDVDLYRDLLKHRPPIEMILDGRERGSNLRYDLSAWQLLGCAASGEWGAGPWVDFIARHIGQRFWWDILDRFEDHITRLHGRAIRKIGVPLREMSVGMRRDEDAIVQLDCQIGLNTPVTEAGRVRGPHIDNPLEIFACMFYMRDPRDESTGGDFGIDALSCHLDELRFYGKAEVRDEFVQRAATVPYKANTACAFINSLASVHEVTPRSVTEYPRLLVNIIAEFKRPLFQYKHLMENR